MGRIRTIKPQFFTSEDVTAQPVLARLLFAGLFTEADREGRVEDRPRQLKTRLLPEDDCDVDVLLWSLVDGRLIRRYESAGVSVIQILSFSKHQRPHPKEAQSILPPDGTDRVKPCNYTESREQVSVHPVEHPSSPPFKGREGVSIREGKGREGSDAPPLRPIISGQASPRNWDRIHGYHVAGFCDWVCFDEQQCSEFAGKIPGDDQALKLKQIKAWALDIRQQWQGQIIPDGSNFDFWRNRWTETHGGSKPANATLKAIRADRSIDEAFR